MSTKFFLTTIPLVLTGVSPNAQLVTIGTRGSTASASSIELAVTNTTAGVTTTNMTFTKAGNPALWISRPLEKAVTVAGTIGINFWSLASAVAALSNVDFQIFRYTASLSVIGSTAIATSSINIHPYTTAKRFFVTLEPTSTALLAGDRIAILGNINPAGGIAAASQTVSFDYNGILQGQDGDSWIEFNEDISTTTAQNPIMQNGPSVGRFEDLRTGIMAVSSFTGQIVSPDARLEDLLNELAAQRDLMGA